METEKFLNELQDESVEFNYQKKNRKLNQPKKKMLEKEKIIIFLYM